MTRTFTILAAIFIAVAPWASSWPVAAGESYAVTFKDNRLDPAELRVPAGIAFELLVRNADATPEEFESEDLDLEKVILGGAEARFDIDALEPGRYKIFGEFHPDTAQGEIVAE
jgi:hypothetical protein